MKTRFHVDLQVIDILMRHFTSILYAISWITYIAMTFVTYPVLHNSCCIPVLPLIGIGTWLFGRRRGLQLVVVSIIHSIILTSIVYADLLVYYQYALSGYMFVIGVVFLTDSLHTNFRFIKETTRKLDQLVEARSTQLKLLTKELLDESENLKIRQGQDLHDGVGQQLTGIQLLSSSLCDQLLEENDRLASFAHRLNNQTSQAHQSVRNISRMLFPVRIAQVGLIPALNELSSGLNEMNRIHSTIEKTDELPALSEHLLLQLYRICQESALYVVENMNTDQLNIQLEQSGTDLLITLQHNGTKRSTTDNTGAYKLIHYRLKQINGRICDNSGSLFKPQTKFIIPLHPMPV